MEIFELEKFNNWWNTGQVKEELLKSFKRDIYDDIKKYISLRQIILLYGLRRMGKTTLMFQIINELLKNSDSKNIFYFSFDERIFDLKEVLDNYQKLILGKTFDSTKETIYLFFDEIQKVEDWESKIKIYYDLYPKVKFFLSGSASVSLRKKSKESLAGRIFSFLIPPLSFEEFLKMKGKDMDKIKSNMNLWSRDLLPLFYQYMKFGSFPELATIENEDIAKKYLIENVVDRIIYKDLPEEFEIKDLELLKNLVYLLGKNPGMTINYHEIAKNLGKDQRTISNYFEYMEFGLLIKFIFNYRGSPLASYRKSKKVYFTTPNLTFAFNDNLEKVFPFMLENIVLLKTNAKFFYKNGFEVDFVVEKENELIGIEVKSENFKIKQLKNFVKKFGRKAKKCFIVDIEKETKIENFEVIPAWKFLLQSFK
ncbi:MAG: ATP-binding protein [Nanoarchaeota archaeon]